MAACDSSVGEAVDVALGFAGGVTIGGSSGNGVTVGVAEAASDASGVEGGAESSASPFRLAILTDLARLQTPVMALSKKT